jgi:hypothetical protein
MGPPTLFKLIHFSKETEALFCAEIILVRQRDTNNAASFMCGGFGGYKCKKIGQSSSAIHKGLFVSVINKLETPRPLVKYLCNHTKWSLMGIKVATGDDLIE